MTNSEKQKMYERKGWKFKISMQIDSQGKHRIWATLGRQSVWAYSWTALFKKI